MLTGEGRSFSAGADLKSGLDPNADTERMLQDEYRPVLESIWNMEKPVIAAVGGSAAGIGVSFALICDLLVMADNAFLLSPFTTISLVPDGGLNWLLVHQLGYRRAFQLSIECERMSADLCVELGLANKSVPAESLMEESVAWAKSLAERAPSVIGGNEKSDATCDFGFVGQHVRHRSTDPESIAEERRQRRGRCRIFRETQSRIQR